MRPVIVGASVAGSVCALRLARAGIASLVLERRVAVHDKVCGEGLQPAGRAIVADVLPDLPSMGQPFYGFAFHVPEAPPLAWTFPLPEHGEGVARGRLDAALREALDEEPLVEVRRGVSVQTARREGARWMLETHGETIEASVVVGADGVRSRMRACTGRARGGERGRWGARARFAARAAERVHIHIGDGVEVYLTPLAPDEVSVALLGEEQDLRAIVEGDFEAYLHALGAHPGGVMQEPPKLLPHLGPRVGTVAKDGLYLVGDAALVLDPVSGAGMTLAALGALHASNAIIALHEGMPAVQAERDYARQFRVSSAPYKRLTGFLLGMGKAPRLRRPVMAFLRSYPAVMGRMARPTLAASVARYAS